MNMAARVNFTRKHEIVLRGGPLNGRVVRTMLGSRGLHVPIMCNDGIGQLVYRPTDKREDGRQVWCIEGYAKGGTT